MLPFMLPFMPGGAEPVGQQAWTTPGTYYFVVPDGVTRLWGLVIGAGGAGASGNVSGGNRIGAGGGGGLAWGCLIVTPGETLTVIAGAAQTSPTGLNGVGANGGMSSIYRGATPLMWGEGGTGGGVDASPTWWPGGTGLVNTAYADLTQAYAAYTGGDGGYGDGLGGPGGGGGCAGYAGNGGDGAEYFGLNGQAAAASSGGAGGGAGGWGGAGVGLLGIGATGAAQIAGDNSGSKPGSGGTSSGNSPNGGVSGGGAGTSGVSGGGAVRVLWGPGRSYPSTNTGDV